MPINSITARKLSRDRQSKQIRELIRRGPVLPVYYEIHSGIMNYRTGQWISHDNVDIVRTLSSARAELAWRLRHPTPGQNAAYLKRRYGHGNQNTAETMESIR